MADLAIGNLLDAARCLSPARSGDAPISRRAITASMEKLGARLDSRNVTRCYMSLLRGLRDAIFRGDRGVTDAVEHIEASCIGGVAAGLDLPDFRQQKSRIQEDPAEFVWKCRLRLTSRGEHSRALMGGGTRP